MYRTHGIMVLHQEKGKKMENVVWGLALFAYYLLAFGSMCGFACFFNQFRTDYKTGRLVHHLTIQGSLLFAWESVEVWRNLVWVSCFILMCELWVPMIFR